MVVGMVLQMAEVSKEYSAEDELAAGHRLHIQRFPAFKHIPASNADSPPRNIASVRCHGHRITGFLCNIPLF